MDNNFQKLITDSFPNLFDKNEVGEPVIRSGCGCPTGWDSLVYEALESINLYTSYSSLPVKINTEFFWKYDTFWKPVYNYIWKFLDTDDISLKERIFQSNTPKRFWRLINKKRQDDDKSKKTYKLREQLNKIDEWLIDSRTRYTSIPVKPVKVDQIKEKFGTLRIYITGGDEYVRGIIGFAEFKSSRTCMFTGEEGERGSINGWIVTATKEELEKRQKEKI